MSEKVKVRQEREQGVRKENRIQVGQERQDQGEMRGYSRHWGPRQNHLAHDTTSAQSHLGKCQESGPPSPKGVKT